MLIDGNSSDRPVFSQCPHIQYFKAFCDSEQFKQTAHLRSIKPGCCLQMNYNYIGHFASCRDTRETLQIGGFGWSVLVLVSVPELFDI